VQCDFDIVGTSAGPADIEVLLLIIAAFEALSVPGITVHLSHRGIFNRFLEREGVRDKSEDVLRIVDKLRKIGAEQTRTLLSDLVSPTVADRILTFVAARGSNDEIITTLETLLEDTSPEIAELRLLVSTATALGYGEAIRVDPSITRGLDYYTGIVFETFLIGAESIGSVCSGGRYDDLVSLYSKETMPGVGASIGLDRLIAALETFDDVLPSPTSADVLVVLQDPTLLTTYHEIARELRADGIRCEVYPEVRKLGQQFAFAEKKGIPIALVCGESEVATGVVNLRELATRTNHDQIPRSDMATRIRELLA
jgi:histidyl-tRNA synthetase